MTMIMPIPLVTGGGGSCTGMQIFWILVVSLYLCQFIMTFINLYMDEFKSKKQFFWWFVPFLPIILGVIKKVREI